MPEARSAFSLDLRNEVWRKTFRERSMAEYRPRLNEARPFCLDDSSTRLIAEIAFNRSGARELRNYLPTALLPFPRTWIETDYYFRDATPLKDNADAQADLDSMKRLRRTGWLLEAIETDARADDPSAQDYRLTRFETQWDSHTRGGLDAHVNLFTQIVYPLAPCVGVRYGQQDEIERIEDRLNADSDYLYGFWGFGERQARQHNLFKGCNAVEIERGFRMAALGLNGARLHFDKVGVNDEGTDWLHQTEYVEGTPTEQIERFVEHSKQQHVDDLRFLVTALALINEVPYRKALHRPAGGIRLNGGMRPYMRTNVITLTIPATPRSLREVQAGLVAKGEAAQRVRHECRAHFRTCDYQPNTTWEPYETSDGRTRYRKRIAAHMRGSAEIGFNHHEGYAVTVGQGR